MIENFLHFIWKHKRVASKKLVTTRNETLCIHSVGIHNHNTGPDFFNARVEINNILWAGNVEIHVKSSDWYVHNHEKDSNYDNVILHVVWQHDVEIFREDNTVIPTLELQHIINSSTLNNYKKLFQKKEKWINCENDFASMDDFLLNNWLERLYFERLEFKFHEIKILLKETKNNWEAVLFIMLAKNFGLKVNGKAFESVAKSFQFSVIQKLHTKEFSIEALLFGQAKLLHEEMEDVYYQKLQKEYRFLKKKFNLHESKSPVQYFRLRPNNFPTIRLSQLAHVYHNHANLFSKIIQAKTKKELYDYFAVSASNYWDHHYTFNKTSKASKKRTTKSFIDLLIINSIIPLQFSYAKHQGKSLEASILSLIEEITSEKNTIVDKYNNLRHIANSAMHSQALLQLKKQYCDKNKCLQCAIGNALLTRID